jgi:hypothetical protein
MVISEKLGGYFLPFSTLFKEKVGVVKERQIKKIKMNDIFISMNNTTFTDFGQRLYGTVIAKDTLLDPKMTSKRREEVLSDIKKRCNELNIKENRLSRIERQLKFLIKKRESNLEEVERITLKKNTCGNIFKTLLKLK